MSLLSIESFSRLTERAVLAGRRAIASVFRGLDSPLD